MPLLDAALAFALTMMLVATAVTLATNVVLQTPAWLGRYFKKLVASRQELFDQMIDEFVRKEMPKIATEARPLAGAVGGDDWKDLQPVCNHLADQITAPAPDGTEPVHLSNADLLEMIRRTPAGQAFLAAVGDRVGDVLAEIERRFAAVERRYTERFRANARRIATAVALVLAVALNIDAVNILGAYVGNPSLSAAVAARSEQALADYDARVKTLTAGGEGEQLKDMQKRQEDLRNQLDRLHAGSLPFGWTYFPFGSSPPRPWTSADAAAKADRWSAVALPVWGGWLLGIGLTVWLAGRGAPFWYDVIRKIVELTRGSPPSTQAPPPVPAVLVTPVPMSPPPGASDTAPAPLSPRTG
jgi:hypothetical protein